MDESRKVEELEAELANIECRYETHIDDITRYTHRLRAALDRITKHPDCHRLIMAIACEALRGGVEREEG